MQKYQSETSDNSCTVVEHHLLSDNSMKPPGQKPDTPTIINGGDDISHQSVKSNTAVRPADLIVSTNSAGVITPLAMAMATATVDRPTGMLDWISDTGTAGADQYSTSESDTSKTPAQPANSNTANTRARDCVTVVVSNGPHPLRPIRPLRTRHTLARYLSQVLAREYKINNNTHSFVDRPPLCKDQNFWSYRSFASLRNVSCFEMASYRHGKESSSSSSASLPSTASEESPSSEKSSRTVRARVRRLCG